MVRWALIFFLFALIAGLPGFFSLAGLAASVAKIFLVAFLALFFISLLSGALVGRPPRVKFFRLLGTLGLAARFNNLSGRSSGHPQPLRPAKRVPAQPVPLPPGCHAKSA